MAISRKHIHFLDMIFFLIIYQTSFSQTITSTTAGGHWDVGGTWIGGFTYSDPASVLFLSIGAGAIFQVVREVIRYRARGTPLLQALGTPVNFSGLLCGFLIMYVTSLFVAA